MGAEAAHAGDGAEVVAEADDHALLLGRRGAGSGDEVDQDVGLAEGGEQALAEVGDDEQGDHGESGEGGVGAAGAVDDAGQQGGVAALQPAGQG